jgi:hypothetical protein
MKVSDLHETCMVLCFVTYSVMCDALCLMKLMEVLFGLHEEVVCLADSCPTYIRKTNFNADSQ